MTRFTSASSLMSSDYLLSILFSISVVGVIRNKKSIYSSEATATDERVRADDHNFVIHPCFRDSLQCVSAINLKPFDSNPIDTEIIISRIGRGLTPYEESTSGYEFFLKETDRLIQRFKKGIASDGLPPEIQEELLISIVSIEGQLESCLDREEPRYTTDTLLKVGTYFSELGSRLDQSAYAGSKSELSDLADRVSLISREFGLGQGRRRFRA